MILRLDGNSVAIYLFSEASINSYDAPFRVPSGILFWVITLIMLHDHTDYARVGSLLCIMAPDYDAI